MGYFTYPKYESPSAYCPNCKSLLTSNLSLAQKYIGGITSWRCVRCGKTFDKKNGKKNWPVIR